MVDAVQNHAVDPFGIVGQVLDAQFRVDRFVGEGGFSAVYRGHHLGLDEPIAIKCLKLPPALSPSLVDQFAKRFRDESRILYRLSKGNLDIVRSIAAGTWRSPTGLVVPYMVLEWMEGRSLANDFAMRRSAGKRGRSLEEVVSLFESAAGGIGHAHAHGVVHRDLNPGNLFLASSPQGTRMKVLDFGVAKILDESTLDIARRQTVGQIRIFAPAYGAPEQFDAAIGKVGAASDVYSLALILLEALRDRCVNEGQSLGEFALKALDPSRRPTPRTFGIDVPDEVEQIFVRATELDPSSRWQSADELWRALTLAVSSTSRTTRAQAAPAMTGTAPLAPPRRQATRITQKGIAPPPEPVPGARMNMTMPFGVVTPKLDVPRPGAVAAPTRQNVSELPTEPSTVVPAPASRPVAGGSVRIHGGATSDKAPLSQGQPQEQEEDEVTCVRAPEPDILRGLADVDAQRLSGTAGMATMQLPSESSPRPAAGASATAPSPLQHSAPVTGGTVLMAANPYAEAAPLPSTAPPPHAQPEPYRPPSGQLGQTVALAGPPSLGVPSSPSLPGTQLSGAPSPSFPGAQPFPGTQVSPPYPGTQLSGAPASLQQPFAPYPAHPHAHAPQPPHPMVQPSPYVMAPSIPEAPKPKKSSALFLALGVGALVLAGVGVAAAVALGGKGEGVEPVASASAEPPASAIVSALPPPTAPPVIEPSPSAVAAEDASEAEAAVVADASAAVAAEDASEAVAAKEDDEADAGSVAKAAPAVPPASKPASVPQPAPTRVVAKKATPAPDPHAFNEAAARSSLAQANGVLIFCKRAGGVTGPGTARVTFGPEGTVTAVSLDPPYAGTTAGDCAAGHFKRTKVSAFEGSPRTIKHSFEVPK